MFNSGRARKDLRCRIRVDRGGRLLIEACSIMTLWQCPYEERELPLDVPAQRLQRQPDPRFRRPRMKSRILTTHVGSLPRNATLSDLLIRQELGVPFDLHELRAEKRKAVCDVVQKQIDAGIDIINDGEQPRVGFQTYVPQRVKGFGGTSVRNVPMDYKEFPDFADMARRRFPRRSNAANAPQAVREIEYEDLSEAKEEIALFEAACGALARRPSSRFMTAASPGIIATTMPNAYYESHERYVFALAREMRKEYELIVASGLTLQLDAPDLAMERTIKFQDRSLSEFLSLVELHIAALNESVKGLPRDRLRLHCCWGNWEGPHLHDVPLSDIFPMLCRADVGALSIEFANPRHQHELKELRKFRFPDDKCLLPGVIDSTNNYVEHPQLIANRIVDAVAAVGDPNRVIASVDCGFGTFTGYEFVAESIVWAKLGALRDGARIATESL
jgi:5-methyltetrahydropteroyltriglutamate--homocysteine methyltransferase